jgi:leader peptidase (prepilin peptidase)/N-methyltransferase
MMDVPETTVSGQDLCPNLAVLFGVGAVVALISTVSLPWPVALASTILGALMIAGAEVDARTHLLPDTVTCGGIALGILAAPALDPFEPWRSTTAAAGARAAGTAFALVLLRWCYARLRGREGLGFGDVKLAAAVGAWLPLASVPFCFALATCAALIMVVSAWMRGESINASAKLPFGAFLCPALWLVFYAGELQG